MSRAQEGGLINGALALLLPHCSPSLFPETALSRIRAAGQVLVPTPSFRLGLECRLGDSEGPVDFSQGFEARDERGALARHARDLALKDGASASWSNIAQFAEEWADESSLFGRFVDELWLEYDLAEENALPTPSVFVGLRGSSTDASDVVAQAVHRLTGEPVEKSVLDTLDRVCSSCEAGETVSHVGAMLSRPTSALRLNIRGLRPERVAAFLESAGWTGDADDVAAAVSMAARLSEAVTLGLDAGASLSPRVGFECFTSRSLELHPDLVAFLERVELEGLCSAEEREAISSWVGIDTPRAAGYPWPSALIRDSLLRDDSLSSFVRIVSHVKAVYTPGARLQAKAYLGFQHLWLRPAEQ